MDIILKPPGKDIYNIRSLAAIPSPPPFLINIITSLIRLHPRLLWSSTVAYTNQQQRSTIDALTTPRLLRLIPTVINTHRFSVNSFY